MTSLTRWTWVWANSRRWRTGTPGALQSMGSQRVRHDWLNNNNSLNVPFGIQGKSRRLNELYCLQIRKRDMKKTFPWEGCTESCSISASWRILNQKTQPSQRSGEGRIYYLQPDSSNWHMSKEGRAQPLKEWHSPRTTNTTKLIWTKWIQNGRQSQQLPLSLKPQYMLYITHQQAKWHSHKARIVLRMSIKDQKSRWGPIPGNLCPFPQIAWIILPLISLWNYPAHKN